MRKIVHRSVHHNPDRLRALAAATLLGLMVLSGCTGPDRTDNANPPKTTDSQAATAGTCRVVNRTLPWETFRSLADRLASGQTPPRTELEAYAALPDVAAWCRSQGTPPPTPANVANWLEGAWWTEQGRAGDQKSSRARATMVGLYRYSQANGERIAGLIADMTTAESGCRIQELAEFWVDADTLPSPLTLVFLPGNDEIRLFENMVMVDTGVLAAGGREQTERQIVSLLYRSLAATPGPNPVEAAGERAVAECLRVFKNEGIAAYIEQTAQVGFDVQHPGLGKVRIIPEEFYRKAQRTIEGMNARLPALLADPAVLAEQGQPFARSLAANNAYTQTGLAMADVIASRLGVERLRSVRDSVPGFLAAFQEAALANAVPVPEPGTAGISLYESVPALEGGVFGMLLELAQKTWPSP